MQVGAERVPDATALEAGLAVVPVTRDDAPERLGSGVEERPPGVVLEARDGRLAAVEVALEEDVADHAAARRRRSRAGGGRFRACPTPSSPR